MNKPKLIPVQQKVILWLIQGWNARVSHEVEVEINDERFCSVDNHDRTPVAGPS